MAVWFEGCQNYRLRYRVIFVAQPVAVRSMILKLIYFICNFL